MEKLFRMLQVIFLAFCISTGLTAAFGIESDSTGFFDEGFGILTQFNIIGDENETD